MSYKDELYARYVSTHLQPLKGDISPKVLRSRAALWSKIYGGFLPEDKGARILDLGCGYGSIVWWLQQSGYAAAGGIDISGEMIETGRKLGIANIEQGDIKARLTDSKAGYGVIFARDLLEHLDREDVLEVLSGSYRALAPGGRMIIQVPNAESPFGSRIRYGDFTHETAFTTSSIAQVLQAAGFSKIRCYAADPPLTGPESLLRLIGWKILASLYKFALYLELGRGKRIVTQNIIAVATK